MDYRKNDLVTVTIEDMGTDGEGIGKIDGFPFFIKDAIIGDVVEAKVTKSKKNYAYARLEKVVTPSPFRITPKCSLHRKCGGCQIQAMDYNRQLRFKQDKVKNNLIRIGGFSKEKIAEVMEPIVGMEEPFRYRNKAQYPIGTDKDGNPVAGFYAGRTHTIIPSTECYLGREENKEILECILQYMKDNHVSAYDETTGKGLIRHILIRSGFLSGEIMVCLVINRKAGKSGASAQKFLPAQEKLVAGLTQITGIKSISVSINTEMTNVIMGNEIHTIWGEPGIKDRIRVRDMQSENMNFTGQELEFAISPLSFFQVNPVQTEKLYSLALEYAGLTGKETVWDLYCGIGTISLFMALQAKQVYGVEIIPQAIDDARENAVRNKIQNATFFVGKAEEVLPDFYEGKVNLGENINANLDVNVQKDVKTADGTGAKELGMKQAEKALHPEVIVVDPPRKGCDERCLATMLKMQPDRIVYVSCDSATLARDLRILCDGGYTLKKVRPVDQFAHTGHVETVVLMSKVNPDK